jgi:hypothetical protein
MVRIRQAHLQSRTQKFVVQKVVETFCVDDSPDALRRILHTEQKVWGSSG